jgi:hypothetical protein
MEISAIPIPERMKKFPLYRGYVVHYTVFVGEDKIPDFKVVHQAHRTEALNKNLCHLCGQRMMPPFAFIGGPKCMKHRRFVDGPMHLECATYAAKVCPYLATPNHGHSKVAPRHTESAIVTTFGSKTGTISRAVPTSEIGRPDRMALALADTYRTIKERGETFIQAGEWLSVDWDIMPKRDHTPT